MIDLLGEKLVYGRKALSVSDIKLSETSIKLYPNPAKDQISISGLSNKSTMHFSVFNITGKEVIYESLLKSL